MENIIKEILQKSKDERKIIGIRIYDNDDFFYSGYVQDFNDEIVRIKHFTEYGKDDGIVFERIENIENIEYDEDYYESLQYLVEINEKLEKSNINGFKYTFVGNWQFDILKMFVGKEIVVVIENYKKEKILGIVNRVTEHELVLNTIGNLGQDEGFSFYRLKDISSIQPDDLECRKRLFLHQWKKK